MRTPLVAAALLALFGAWLAVPRPVTADERRELCLVDVSASVRRPRPDWGAWVGDRVEAFARDAATRGAHTWVVAVARGHRELAPREDARALLERVRRGELVDLAPPGLDPLGTSVDAALAACEDWLLGGRGGRVVWLGDGDVGDDPLAAADRLERLARNGVACELVEPPPPTRPDARITRFDVPRSLDSGAPLAVRVEVDQAVSVESTAELEVALIEPGSRESVVAVRRGEIDLSRGGRSRAAFEFEPPASGVWLVRATVRARGDGVPENDVREAICRVGGELVGQVATRSVDLDEAQRLAAALERGLPGTSFTATTLDEVATLLPHTDVVVALDVPPSDLPVAVLEPFVRAGGGLLTLGEVSQHVRSSRGVGADLLPLVCAPPGIEPRDVVLLLDGSGSMAGAPFEAVRTAARDILLATPPGDGLQVAIFTDGYAGTPLRIRAGEELDERAQQAAERWLARIEAPGGKTSIVRSLERWVRDRGESLEREGERRAAVILLTDGREDVDTPNVWSRVERIRADLAQVHAKLYSVAIGDPVDREFLERLVPSPELRLEPAPEDLRRAVADVAASERLLDGPLRARATPAGLDAGLPAFLSELTRASRAKVRDGATVLLEGEGGESLLAEWPVGAGRVASAAFGTTWCGDLVGRPERFGGLVRRLARRDEGAATTLVRDDRGLVLLGAPSVGAVLTGVLEVADRPPRTARLVSTPGGFRIAAADLADLEASPHGGWLTVAGLGRFPVPARAPRELREQPGRVLAGRSATTPPPSARDGHPAAAYVLALAGALAALAALPLPGAGRRGVKPAGGGLR